MSKGKIKEFVKPTGVSPLSGIFLAIVRIALIIYLLSNNPLSLGFGHLLIILFFISIVRHLLFYFSKPIPDNIYNFFLDLLTPCLYGFMLFHIFTIYGADFLLLLVSFFLPGIMYCVLFWREPDQGMGKRTFWGGVFCYAFAFLLTLNYAFDFSNPVVEKYFLAKKYTAVVDYEGNKGEDYYFDLIPVDSISTSADWVDVNRKTCTYYHNSWMYKTIKLGNETFMVLDKRTQSNIKHQCSFLLQKINDPIHKKITELQYARFEKGDTFNIEKHRGLLGIEWLTYR